MSADRDIVQTRNPRSGHYVKIDRSAGRIIAHKFQLILNKGIPVAGRHAK